jgi:hypothetical protein
VQKVCLSVSPQMYHEDEITLLDNYNTLVIIIIITFISVSWNSWDITLKIQKSYSPFSSGRQPSSYRFLHRFIICDLTKTRHTLRWIIL